MKKILQKSLSQLRMLLLLAVMFVAGSSAWAQDATFDFNKYSLTTSDLQKNGVSVTGYHTSYGSTEYALNIWGDHNGTYKLNLTSEVEIVRIEFEGKRSSYDYGYAVVAGATDDFTYNPSGTSVWNGESKNVTFYGTSGNTDFYVQSMRVWLKSSGSGGGSGSDNVPVDPSAPVYNAVKVQNAEVGKVYTLTMFNYSQQEYPLTIENGRITPKQGASHTMFECGNSGDGLFFITADGKYLRNVHAVGNWVTTSGTQGNDGSDSGLSSTYKASLDVLEFEPVPFSASNITSSNAYNKGCVAIHQARFTGHPGYTTFLNTGGNSGSDQIYYSNDATSAFILREVQAFPTSTLGQEGSDYYGTYYANHAWEIPAGYEAYVVTGVDGGQMTLEEVTGTVVGANTAVILKGARSENLPIQFSLETGYTNANNMLRGTVEDFNNIHEDGYKYYVMTYAQGGGNLGFYWQNGSGDGSTVNCAAHKAYLRVPVAGGASNGFRFRFDDVTAIEGINTEADNAPVFNLQGQRVNAAKAGVYVKNGRKFIVK